MRNIAEVVEEIVKETGKAEPLALLTKEVKKRDADYKKYDDVELAALIHTTLSIDGRFVFLNELWDIKSRYSVMDLESIKEAYIKNMTDSEMEELNQIEKELENDEDIEAFNGPDRAFEEDDDDVTDIEGLSITDEDGL